MNTAEKQDIINRFNKLSKNDQEEVLKDLIKMIEIYENKNLELGVKKICELNGHDFTEWESITEIITRTDVLENESYKFNTMKRKCQRCGFIQTQYKEPFEIIKNENIEDIIKTLRKRINKDN